jgi:bacterioferritin-associated ferredoxin
MIVCICHRVSDRDIERAALQGCASFEQLQDELRVATCCGLCRDCARDTFHEHAGVAVQQVAWAPARPAAVAADRRLAASTAG